jgi:hypothetical protein
VVTEQSLRRRDDDFKWETGHLRLFAIGADDNVRVLDLMAIIEPAVRKRLRQLVKNPRAYVFLFGMPIHPSRSTIAAG